MENFTSHIYVSSIKIGKKVEGGMTIIPVSGTSKEKGVFLGKKNTQFR